MVQQTLEPRGGAPHQAGGPRCGVAALGEQGRLSHRRGVGFGAEHRNVDALWKVQHVSQLGLGEVVVPKRAPRENRHVFRRSPSGPRATGRETGRAGSERAAPCGLGGRRDLLSEDRTGSAPTGAYRAASAAPDRSHHGVVHGGDDPGQLADRRDGAAEGLDGTRALPGRHELREQDGVRREPDMAPTGGERSPCSERARVPVPRCGSPTRGQRFRDRRRQGDAVLLQKGGSLSQQALSAGRQRLLASLAPCAAPQNGVAQVLPPTQLDEGQRCPCRQTAPRGG